jgi:hypothetical protein
MEVPPSSIVIPIFLGWLSNDGPGDCRRLGKIEDSSRPLLSSDCPSAVGLDMPVLRFFVRSTVGDGIAILSASDSYPGEIWLSPEFRPFPSCDADG